jgi:predicted GNAT family N-acyltransferase
MFLMDYLSFVSTMAIAPAGQGSFATASSCVIIAPAISPGLLARCHSLRKRVFVDELGVASSLEFDRYDAAPGPSVAHLLATTPASSIAGENPVATCRVRAADFGAKLERLCVDKRARRAGIGAKLVRAVEDLHAATDGPLYCYAKRDSQPFYERLGWVAEGPMFVEAGVEHVAMVRRRAPLGVQCGLGHVAFCTPDIDAARRFYILLGFRDESRYLVSGYRAALIQVWQANFP